MKVSDFKACIKIRVESLVFALELFGYSQSHPLLELGINILHGFTYLWKATKMELRTRFRSESFSFHPFSA